MLYRNEEKAFIQCFFGIMYWTKAGKMDYILLLFPYDQNPRFLFFIVFYMLLSML